MKKFVLHTLLFVSVLIAGVVVLFVMPVDRKYAYSFLFKGGCQGRAPWIYRQIFEDTTEIDVAFLGTSHTMNAINDQYIQNTLRDSFNVQHNCRNLSFCGFGRDLDYVFIKDLLQHKQVKTIVLEVRESESPFGHQSFPYVAKAADVFNAPKYFSRSYLPAIYKQLLFRLQYLREKVTGEDKKRITEIPDSPYGFNINYAQIDGTELQLARQRATARRQKQIELVENTLAYAQTQYVQQIAELAKTHHTKLLFVYLPSYTGRVATTEIEQRYKKFGTVIYNEPVYDDTSMWADKEHVNNKGAAAISAKVAAVLGSI